MLLSHAVSHTVLTAQRSREGVDWSETSGRLIACIRVTISAACEDVGATTRHANQKRSICEKFFDQSPMFERLLFPLDETRQSLMDMKLSGHFKQAMATGTGSTTAAERVPQLLGITANLSSFAWRSRCIETSRSL